MTKPFKVKISDKVLQNIYSKVKKYEWHFSFVECCNNYRANIRWQNKRFFFKYTTYVRSFLSVTDHNQSVMGEWKKNICLN